MRRVSYDEFMPQKKIKLLIVEDTELFRKNFQQIARTNHFEIVGETDGQKGALKIIEEKKPDVAILDLVLPDQDIVEFIKAVKKQSPSLPLIACSSLREEHIMADVLQAGCFDYIVKPFEEKRLVESIQSAVK